MKNHDLKQEVLTIYSHFCNATAVCTGYKNNSYKNVVLIARILMVSVCFEYSLSRLIFSVNLDEKHKKGRSEHYADAHVQQQEKKAALCARGGGDTLAFVSLA